MGVSNPAIRPREGISILQKKSCLSRRSRHLEPRGFPYIVISSEVPRSCFLALGLVGARRSRGLSLAVFRVDDESQTPEFHGASVVVVLSILCDSTISFLFVSVSSFSVRIFSPVELYR